MSLFSQAPSIPVTVHMFEGAKKYHEYSRRFWSVPRVGDYIIAEHYGDHVLEVINVIHIDSHLQTESYVLLNTQKRKEL